MDIKYIKGSSPFVIFSPFLLLYIFYVLHFHTDAMIGDEARYMEFAENLLHGYYSPAYPNIDLINGPGYPIILMPFAALKLPLVCIPLLNALLHYLSVVFVFKSIKMVTQSFTYACITAFCWASYFLAWQEMPCILTETFTLFLISLFCYQVLRISKSDSFQYKPIAFTGLTLGFLILTKVIFAYAVLGLLLFTILLYLLNKRAATYKKLVFVLLTAMLVISPYVFYTYQLTSKFFYLSSEGGKVLYWMTSTSENEYGDWNNNSYTANCKGPNDFCNADLIRKNHDVDMQRINNTKTVLEADSLFKAMAIRNIKAYPAKYVKNWFANIGRLLFGFPASYYFQSPTTLVRIYINSFLLLGMLYSFVVTLVNWKNIPTSIRFLAVFVLLYLFCSSLVSAFPRQFNVIVPILLIWISYILKSTIHVRISFDK